MAPVPHAAVAPARGARFARLASPGALALAIALVFALKAFVGLSAASRGVSQFIDDAFYYLLIARNFADSGVPTFDGVNATNGFHPLWMLMLAGMYKVIGTGAGLFVQVVAAKSLELLTLAGALAVCLLGYRRLRLSTPLAWGFPGAALILLAPRLYVFEQGMESTLAAGLLLAALYGAIDRRPAWLMVTLPLLFLARLDSLVFVIGPLALWWVLQEGPAWRAHVRTFAPVALVATAFIGMNIALTGEANTISGQIKSSFPAITPHWSYLIEPLLLGPHLGWRMLYAYPNTLVVATGLALVAGACAWRRREPWARPVAWVILMAALLVANVLLFQRWDKGVDARYLSLPYVLMGFAAFAALAALLRRRESAVWVFGVLLAACALVWVDRYREERPMRMDLTKAGEVKAATRPGERFAGTDVGAFSFWLERPFVNLDGLVNNRELQEAIRDKRLADYLERQDVRYLLAAFWDREQALVSERPERMYRSRIFPAGVAGTDYPHYDFTLYSYIHDAESEAIRFCPGEEIFREAIGRDGLANATLVIYRVPRPIRRAGQPDASCAPAR
jgi:hypothetical protein